MIIILFNKAVHIALRLIISQEIQYKTIMQILKHIKFQFTSI
jgi:hypothetical protein